MTTQRGLLVGFSEDDPRRERLIKELGYTRPSGRCRVCRRKVYLDEAGRRTLRDRAEILMCRVCADERASPLDVLDGA